MSSFNEIESLFSKLLVAGGSVLADQELAEIKSFIDVGEYGLALQTAVDIFVEEDKIAPDDVVSLIERIAAAMSIEPALMLQRLPKEPR